MTSTSSTMGRLFRPWAITATMTSEDGGKEAMTRRVCENEASDDTAPYKIRQGSATITNLVCDNVVAGKFCNVQRSNIASDVRIINRDCDNATMANISPGISNVIEPKVCDNSLTTSSKISDKRTVESRIRARESTITATKGRGITSEYSNSEQDCTISTTSHNRTQRTRKSSRRDSVPQSYPFPVMYDVSSAFAPPPPPPPPPLGAWGFASEVTCCAAEAAMLEEYGRLLHEAQLQQQLKNRKQRPKKFRCPHCQVAFSNNGQLKGHVRIHTGERPFRCDQCGKSFTRNEELTRHKRIHSGLRPYACAVCGKRFGRKDHLKKHARTHQLRLPSAQPLLLPPPFLYAGF